MNKEKIKKIKLTYYDYVKSTYDTCIIDLTHVILCNIAEKVMIQ